MKKVFLVATLMLSMTSLAFSFEYESLYNNTCRVISHAPIAFQGNYVGSGAFIKEDDNNYYAITNGHVVRFPRVTVQTFHDSKYGPEIPAKIIYRIYTEKLDFAILSVSKTAMIEKPQIVEFVPFKTDIDVSKKIFGCGFPEGKWAQIWFGRIISQNGGNFSIDAPPVEGQSGSVVMQLINDKPRAIGLLTWNIKSTTRDFKKQEFGSMISVKTILEHLYDRQMIKRPVSTGLCTTCGRPLSQHIVIPGLSDCKKIYCPDDGLDNWLYNRNLVGVPKKNCSKCHGQKPENNGNSNSDGIEGVPDFISNGDSESFPDLNGSPIDEPEKFERPDKPQETPEPAPDPEGDVEPIKQNNNVPGPPEPSEIEKLRSEFQKHKDNLTNLEKQGKLTWDALEKIRKSVEDINLSDLKDSAKKAASEELSKVMSRLNDLEKSLIEKAKDKIIPKDNTDSSNEKVGIVESLKENVKRYVWTWLFGTGIASTVAGYGVNYLINRRKKKKNGEKQSEENPSKTEEKNEKTLGPGYNNIVTNNVFIPENFPSQSIKELMQLKESEGEKTGLWVYKAELYKKAVEMLRYGNIHYEHDPANPILGAVRTADKIDEWVQNQLCGIIEKEGNFDSNKYNTAYLGTLYWRAVNLLRDGHFNTLNGPDTANAIEKWVKQEFLKKLNLVK